MLVILIIFFITIVTVFGMLIYRAWEIKTERVQTPVSVRKIVPEIYFRHIEKIMLYLAKYIIQWVVLMIVKYWYVIGAKTKKWIGKNLPKIHHFLKRKTKDVNQQKNSFVRRAVLESKTKIRRIKEKVKRDHA